MIRKCGMWTLGENFTFAIREKKDVSHQLITKGIYRLIRHPGYLGWFMWSIGLQLLLGNYFCFVLFTLISWFFFWERIRFEEARMREIFGKDFDDYKKEVPFSGIPFV